MQLAKLIELQGKDFSGEEVTRLYEVYTGDWVKVISSSANGYWYTREYYESTLSEYTPIDFARIQVISDGGVIGYWPNWGRFYEFLKFYLRAEIIEEINAS